MANSLNGLRRALFSSTAIACAAAGSPAMAQITNVDAPSYSLVGADEQTGAEGEAPQARDAAEEQDAGDTASSASDIVVTGSRVITNGNNSPTPLTVVSTDTLQSTTPTNIPDGLRKLPVFANSRNQATLGNPGVNNVGNFLNLRGFGPVRTLILLDGHRVPPTNAEGAVDVNTLPQMLMERVEVVTGGASAVYGSDAVTGVVNFILDKDFTGLKANASTGISQRGDNFTWRAGLAGGLDLFDGRGHFVASYEHFTSDGIDDKFKRKNGRRLFGETGSGTAANPFRLVSDTRNNNTTFGGLILSGPLADQQFIANGVLAPFVHGLPTGSAGIESGGDGTWTFGTSLTAALKTDQAFGRFDFDLTDEISFFVQGNVAWANNSSNFTHFGLNNVQIDSLNPYLPASIQATLTSAGVSNFRFGRVIQSEDAVMGIANTRSIIAMTGLNGALGAFKWDVYYTHGETRQRVTARNNTNNGRLAASLDAVRDSSGNIVCRVTLTNPGLYPGCVPMNPFGPTTDVSAAAAYLRGDTRFSLTNEIDDVGASIVGSPFSTWAGPVRMALSGEYRWQSLDNLSNAQPAERVDCTGLRYNCTPGATPLWFSNTVADAHASQRVGEVALEADVPLVTDVPFFHSLNVNGAVRYTDYSTSGSVTTWKAGVDWHLTDDLRLRGTRSLDIRAPTLIELFGPINQSLTTYTDIHTNTAGITTTQSQGNPNLVPERAKTWTLGAVYSPDWLPGFSVAVDWYRIKVANAISSIGGTSAATQQQCEASNGTSPLCTLYIRPFPFENRTPANFPTLLLNQGLNVTSAGIQGVDGEVNYSFSPSGGDRLSLRGLVSHVSSNKLIQFPGAPVIDNAGVAGQSNVAGVPKWRASVFTSYDANLWSLDILTRWRGRLKQSGNPTLVFANGKVPSATFTDLTLTIKPEKRFEMFLSVQNLFDKEAPVFISTFFAAAPSFFYPAVNDDDIVGRYFTAGVRLKL